MTLRDRLIQLARSQPLALTLNLNEMIDVPWSARENFALAAARMAQDDMLAFIDDMPYDASSTEIARLRATLRALRDGLEP